MRGDGELLKIKLSTTDDANKELNDQKALLKEILGKRYK